MWGAGCSPAGGLPPGACRPIYKGFQRGTNPPQAANQAANLPHSLGRIHCFGKTNWHWALLPAGGPRGRGAGGGGGGISHAWQGKSYTQPEGGEGLAKRKGVVARRGLKEAWSKSASR